MFNNTWIKLAVVSLAGIVISFGVIWGIGVSFFIKSSHSNVNILIKINCSLSIVNDQDGRKTMGQSLIRKVLHINGMTCTGCETRTVVNIYQKIYKL